MESDFVDLHRIKVVLVLHGHLMRVRALAFLVSVFRGGLICEFIPL